MSHNYHAFNNTRSLLWCYRKFTTQIATIDVQNHSRKSSRFILRPLIYSTLLALLRKQRISLSLSLSLGSLESETSSTLPNRFLIRTSFYPTIGVINKMSHLEPLELQHPFFRTVSFAWIVAYVNKIFFSALLLAWSRNRDDTPWTIPVAAPHFSRSILCANRRWSKQNTSSHLFYYWRCQQNDALGPLRMQYYPTFRIPILSSFAWIAALNKNFSSNLLWALSWKTRCVSLHSSSFAVGKF